MNLDPRCSECKKPSLADDGYEGLDNFGKTQLVPGCLLGLKTGLVIGWSFKRTWWYTKTDNDVDNKVFLSYIQNILWINPIYIINIS